MSKNTGRTVAAGCTVAGSEFVRAYRGYDKETGRRLQASGDRKGTVEEAWELWAKLKQQVENRNTFPKAGNGGGLSPRVAGEVCQA